ncbi:hypothetical protein MKZ38_008227 [Zalerion maritima]|uniref:Uncharacterized protein n=1 Tax=Zalerion maritima TaxID=339359 RepID=A0AAD5RHD2_9PEZI|nr:hypothetical protein MKZ38_008227 [Zalerion maritima]
MAQMPHSSSDTQTQRSSALPAAHDAKAETRPRVCEEEATAAKRKRRLSWTVLRSWIECPSMARDLLARPGRFTIQPAGRHVCDPAGALVPWLPGASFGRGGKEWAAGGRTTSDRILESRRPSSHSRMPRLGAAVFCIAHHATTNHAPVAMTGLAVWQMLKIETGGFIQLDYETTFHT